ncbi:hypothetical protein BC828DRAFT_416288 [Blastocladiella britannica]|nr:hypothetical protein BC828DRAFT_416288 [Blastocladiella britannica]
MSARLEDAERYTASARKAVTKPTFALFWKPDYDTAAQEFERAAGCFKNGGRPDLAIGSHLDSADQWVRAGSYFMAAKNTELAANLAATALTPRDPRRGAELYWKASDLFVLNATPDRAAETMEKSARTAHDAGDPNMAVERYQACIELFLQEEKRRFALDVVKKAAGYCFKENLTAPGLAFLQQQLAITTDLANVHGRSQASLALVLALLASNQADNARIAFETAMTTAAFSRDEAIAASAVLDAYDAADADALAKTLVVPTVTFLDSQIVRLARSITAPTAPRVALPPVPGMMATGPPVGIPGYDAGPPTGGGAPPPLPPKAAAVPGFAPVAAAGPVAGSSSSLGAVPAPMIPGYAPVALPPPPTAPAPPAGDDFEDFS